MNKIFYSLIFYMVIIFLPIKSLADIQLSKELSLSASKTYGYCIGQNYTLDQISKKYPALSNDVFLAKSEFDLVFGSSLENMDKFMSKNLSAGWSDIKKGLQAQIRETLKSQVMTKTNAVQFVDTVKKRAKGKIDSPVLETLLIFKSGYEERPEEEFLDGYRYIYSSNGSGKAKGVKLSIKVPKTWVAKEADRPNIVQKFISPSGVMLMVIIKDIPLEANEIFTEKDMDDMLSRENVKLLLPPGATYLNSGKLTLENLPGLWLQYKVKAIRVRMSIEMETIMYMIVYKNKMIQIQGSNVLSVNENTIDNGGLKKYEKLFDLMANSFVIDGLYE